MIELESVSLTECVSKLVHAAEQLEKLKSRIGRLPKSDLQQRLKSIVELTQAKVARECETAYMSIDYDMSRAGTLDPDLRDEMLEALVKDRLPVKPKLPNYFK